MALGIELLRIRVATTLCNITCNFNFYAQLNQVLANFMKLLCNLLFFLNQQVTLQKSLPLNSGGRFSRDIVNNPVDAAHFVDDPVADFSE